MTAADAVAHADADPTTFDGRPVARAVAATLDARPVAGAVAATLDGRPVAGAVAATLDRRPVAGAVAIAVAGALRGAHERALAFSDDGRAERGADFGTGPPAYT